MNEDYREFIQLLHTETGIDLSLYKEAQMKRRLTSLRDKRGYSTFLNYYSSFHSQPHLLEELLDRMTINVSQFYRNRKRFEILEKKVLPYLLQNKNHLKVWSAACSTGEEPYTLAMIINHFLPLQNIEIMATDLDGQALEKARQGVYPERSLNEVPEEIKRKYFVKTGSSYKVNDDIRNCVTFKKHNLLADPFIPSCDLIVCRNVLIYFTEAAKHYIYENFSRSLEGGGIFFVGSAEQIFSPQRYQLAVFDAFFYKRMCKSLM
ncbi:chemotaxis protein CheR [Halobacillus halophilus]|uniref:protein-glutamate O-methyltransferase n=1 Tax=Halobacillus halophilus (strain ATCC 35676 / DSM 2266 / JCM 20832 / KCTC 3685 / LMG 17431 / NBRC 102448 / NCIMB 2269) TaxID=866895 RepID=I0JNA6_HALH3|nr:chemotaxis protein CheR [Halobacillus halophilus]CCG45626.1 chemotaxis protein methyltransferase [Halobacillus halophilus DSM 2266]